MANVTAFAAATGYLDWDDVLDEAGTVLGSGTTFLVIENLDGTETHFFGTGFTYSVTGEVTGGTLNTMQHTVAGGATVLGESLGHSASMVIAANHFTTDVDDFLDFVYSGNDTITIQESDDVSISGLGGNDVIVGGDGNDTISGGDGNDTLDGGEGDDTLHLQNTFFNFNQYDVVNGSTGDDTIDFGNGNSYFELHYNAGVDQVSGSITANLDTGSINKGVDGTDTLLNFSNINFYSGGGIGVWGTSGDDTFIGSSIGNSWQQFRGFGGNNTFTGMGGTVRVDYRAAGSGIDIDLDAGIAADNGYGGTDTLSNIYEIRGSDHDDIMTGDANNNSFIGRAGDDTIDGGDGYDRVRYDRGGVGSVNVNLDTGVVSSDGLGGTDTLTSIEHVRGSNTGNDIIVGSAANERLEGRGGNDTLTGGDGSDELYGGDGDDIINMGNANTNADDYDYAVTGTGDDTVDFGTGLGFFVLDYASLSMGINANLDTSTISKGASGTDTVIGFSSIDFNDGKSGISVHGSYSGDDTFVGSSISGSWQQFRAFGGDNTFTGMGGFVRIDYRTATSGITVNMATGTTTDNGFGGTDTFTNIQEIRGSNHDDTMLGDADNNRFYGLGGDDDIDGGAGFDTARYDRNGTGAITVDLETGVALDGHGGTDTLTSIEHVRGSKTGDDSITGSNAVGETLEGLGGNDTLSGRGGDDTLNGGDGDDNLYGGSGNDKLYGAAGEDYIKGHSGDDYLKGHSGDDYLRGGDGIDTLKGGTGDDLLKGEDGDDTIYGEEGKDVFYGGNGDDKLYGGGDDDKLYGGAGDDYIKGHSGADYLKGHSGEDYLRGGTGNDTLKGGADNDLLLGEENDDTIYGEDGDDDIYGGTGVDVLYGDDGSDLIHGEDGEDTEYGGNGNDTLYGGNHDDNLYGGGGADKLYGGGGDDYIKGHSGEDYLKGHSGDDYLRGGTGDDLLKGGSGIDLLKGEENDDTLYGEDGNDTLYGNSGDDNLYGGGGNDNLYGGSGVDYIKGHSGNDYLKGHSGNDRLRGGSGNDRLNGGSGDDRLEGETGTDTFIFEDSWGDDIVTDFDVAGSEKLDFSDIAAIIQISDLTITYGATDTTIDFGSDSITLEGSTATLLVGDFVF